MVTGHVFIATSLDGFIARPDGDIGWLLALDDPAEDHGYDAFIATIDSIVMGRGTFETIRDVRPWPYSRPVTVLSASLRQNDLPADLTGSVQVTAASPEAVMTSLQAEGRVRVYVDGGQVIQSFLRAGLIADMVITQVPVLLGAGRRMFGALEADIPLHHEGTTAFPSGLVQSRYRIGA